jgi:copper(I)-binding protein
MLILTAAVLAILGCSDSGPPLVAADVVIKKPMPGMHMSAGYLSLTNTSDDPITITAVSSPQFAAVEMHETIIEDGVSRMVELAELAVPPSSTVNFEPGGKHLMLMRPTGELQQVTLDFHAGDTVVLTIEVTAAQ